MFENVVVPLDGSVLAECALPTAVELCRRTHAKLALARVHQPPEMAVTHAYEWDRETRLRESAYLEQVAAGLREQLDSEAEAIVLNGHAADAIAAAAESRAAPLVVMTSHGRTGFSRTWLGSVADAVIRRVGLPVLLIRGSKDEDANGLGRIERVLATIDGSATSRKILPYAASLASALEASLQLVRVITPADVPQAPDELVEHAAEATVRGAKEELENVAELLRARTPGLDVRVCVRAADSVADAIIKAAQPRTSTVVAMTTRTRGLTRVVLGSVADKVIRDGPRFLLLLGPSAMRSTSNSTSSERGHHVIGTRGGVRRTGSLHTRLRPLD